MIEPIHRSKFIILVHASSSNHLSNLITSTNFLDVKLSNPFV